MFFGRADPRYRLESFTHERVLKRQPFRVKNGTPTMSIIPDALLDFYLTAKQGQFRMPVFLEHHRATEELQYFWRRSRGYIALLKTDAFQERLASARSPWCSRRSRVTSDSNRCGDGQGKKYR